MIAGLYLQEIRFARTIMFEFLLLKLHYNSKCESDASFNLY